MNVHFWGWQKLQARSHRKVKRRVVEAAASLALPVELAEVRRGAAHECALPGLLAPPPPLAPPLFFFVTRGRGRWGRAIRWSCRCFRKSTATRVTRFAHFSRVAARAHPLLLSK